MNLFKHQQAALDKARGKQAFAFFMDCGTGKSLTSIVKAREENCSRILVVTFNSITHNWRRELIKHGEAEDQVVILEGNKDRKIKLLYHGTKWVIMNYDSVPTLIEELVDWQFDAVILDESTAIKNPKAKRTKACHKLNKARVRMVLTGTPMPNPLAIWAQMFFLDPSICGRSYWAFMYTYAIIKEKWFGPRAVKVVDGYQNVEALIKVIEPHVFFCKKEDCLDIPDKIYEIRDVAMPPELMRVYKELNEDFIADILPGSTATVDNALAKGIRLQELLGGFVYSADNQTQVESWKQIEENKTVVLLEVLEEIGVKKIGEVRQAPKAVVFCRFIPEIIKLQNLLTAEGYSVEKIHGDVSTERRDELAYKFRTDDDHQILICQTTTAGYGIDLTGANYEIFYSNDWSVIVRTQDEDRVHRQGQRNQVTIIDLITRFPKDAEGKVECMTLDEMVYNSLILKKGFETYIREIKWRGV